MFSRHLDGHYKAITFYPFQALASLYLCIFITGRKICYAGYKHPCYKIAYFQDLAARVGYHHAHHVCSGEGGHLLSVESEAEQKLIERMLQNLTNSGSGKSDGDFWIGLSRNVESMATSGGCPDLYKWADGSTALFRYNY